MISMYFNARLTNSKLFGDDPKAGWFYPVLYPANGIDTSYNQRNVLEKALKSYSKLSFDSAYFNIEIDNISDLTKIDLRKFIERHIKCNNLVVNFKRPGTLEEWKLDLEKACKTIGSDIPVLVAMNHDHIFVDADSKVFDSVVNNVFGKSSEGNNEKKIFIYSHAPENISLIYSNKSYFGNARIKYFENENGLYKAWPIDDWVDSICVMTMPTLAHIFDRMKFTGCYLGRIDWPGVSYKKLGLEAYIFPREFFKHYDGYGHVSGMRLISDLRAGIEWDLNECHTKEQVIEYYYQKWMDEYIFYLRDSLTKKPFYQPKKYFFIKNLEFTMQNFKKYHIDVDENTIDSIDFNSNELYGLLKSKVYYNANYIYMNIYYDNILLGNRFIAKIFNKINKFLG